MFTDLIITFIWGGVATFSFYEVWMGGLGLLACVIGMFRKRPAYRKILFHAYNYTVKIIFYGLVFAVFSGFCWLSLGLGRTETETLSFFISALIMMAVVMPKIPDRVDQIWRSAG